MTEQPFVSIIVPVYNVEPYLERCLNSIRGQSWENLEVWLVNDGSTDGSLALCRAAEEADSRFHVIDKPNSGVSDSRNAALDRAAGTYIQFVDGDDYLEPFATETLIRAAVASGADLTIAHFYRVSGTREARQGHIREEKLLTRREFAEEMMKAPANFYYGVLWNKLYRRSLIAANGLRFEKELNWCEDFLFNLEYIKYARLITAVPKPIYHYVKRAGSLVMTESTLRKCIETKRTTFAYYKQLYQQLDLYEEQKAGVYRYLVSAATDGGSVGLPETPEFMKDLTQKRPHRQSNSPKKDKT